jgi:phage tail sheath gpL-like
MTLAFKNIPANLRVPLFYAEVDPSRANTAVLNQRALLIGQITSSGVAAPDVPLISAGVVDAKSQGGQGSVLALMAAAYRANDPFGEVWYLPLSDNAPAVGTVTFSANPAPSDTLTLNGSAVTFVSALTSGLQVLIGSTLAATLANLLAFLQASADTQLVKFTYSIVGSVLNLTAVTRGTGGNSLTLAKSSTAIAVSGATLSGGVTGVAATGTIVATAAPTANGTLHLYIAGVYVPVTITSGMTTTQVATAIAAAVNAINDLPVTASPSTATVTLTAKNAGVVGNEIDIRANYLGAAGGQSLPTGLTITITPMASGAGTPSLAAGLANLADQPFDFIACPYTDTTTLDVLKAFLNDSAGRWSWAVQVYGHVFVAYRGQLAAQIALGTGRNDQHATILGFYDSPTPNYVWVAAVTAQVSISVRADPGVPLRDVALHGVLAPPMPSRFTLSAAQSLLSTGISTSKVGADGTVFIQRLITTYQTNTFSQPDNSYLAANTMFQLMFILRALAGVVTTKYNRVKLAADGTRFNAGSNIVTPKVIKADLIAMYQQLELGGYVQNSKAFAQAIIVEINAQNPSRVDVLYPPTLIEQLDIFAVLAQFRLQ